jgi:hypothetical protein
MALETATAQRMLGDHAIAFEHPVGQARRHGTFKVLRAGLRGPRPGKPGFA